MLTRLKNFFFGGETHIRQTGPVRAARMVRAKYDAALTTDNNRKHWKNADGLSAKAANSLFVRQTLRNRARYEIANNSYARGMVLTLANDCIGTGPRLQLLSENRDANVLIEREFSRWARAISLPEKLRTLRMAKAEDGEGFGILTNNPRLNSQVKLDLKLVEADQVTTPSLNVFAPNAVDGVVLDDFGNAAEFHVLRNHPGDNITRFTLEYDRVPAQTMLHYFRVDRPGQARGIPEITPALPLFAMLRDYSLATLDAAKAAAYFAGILYTDAPPDGETDSVEPMDTIELERNMLLTMPGGWKMGQVEAQQPASSYVEFQHQILNEIARCLNMPFNIAAGNSSGYNYASGRLDHQMYFKAIRVEQAHIGTAILDRILTAWIEEAVLIDGFLPQSMRGLSSDWSHQWFWDGWEHVDPAKEANAQATRLQNNTTTLATEFAKSGRDWESELRQRAKEVSLMNELGLTLAQAQPAAAPNKAAPVGTDEESDDVPAPEDY